MQQGRFDEAHNTLKRLHAGKAQIGHAQAEKEFYQLKRQVEYDREVSRSKSGLEIFSGAANRKRCLVGVIMMFCNMFTGILLIANYAVIIFTSLGLTGSTPLLLLSIWVSLSIIGNTFTAIFLDSWGRRRFLLIGIAGILVCLIFECAFQAVYTGTDNKAGQRAAVFFIFAIIVFWSSCVDATQFVYLSEIFPTHIRGQGVAVGMTAWYSAQIIILVAGPIALSRIAWRFLLVLIVPTAIYWVLVYLLFPETRQKSLEDINEAFGDVTVVHYHDRTETEVREYTSAIEVEAIDQLGQAAKSG